ncbi:MAG: hypothetical protein JW881_19625 [Spirochaetales bacterium]|nr:hypothetical protein [Spirochaetales bacterium]
MRITKYDAARDGGVDLYKRFSHINDNIFAVDGNILLVDNEKKNTYIYNSAGKYMPANETRKIMNEIRANSRNVTAIDEELNDFLNKNNLIMRNDRILTYNYYLYNEYYKIVKKNRKTKTTEEKYDFDISILNILRLIGFDKDNNSYWHAETGRYLKKTILVHSPYGEVLDCFYNESERYHAAVSPSGDVYFMNMDENGIYFSKITRNW